MSYKVKQFGHPVEIKLSTYIITDKWDTTLQMQVAMRNPQISIIFSRDEDVNFSNPDISNDDLLHMGMRSLWLNVQEQIRENLIELKAYPKDMASLDKLRMDDAKKR